MLEFVAEMLYYAVDEAYDTMASGLVEHWDSTAASFNNGQQSIYGYYLENELYSFLDSAQEAWPWVESNEYVYGMYSAYDTDVLERAFSDAIWSPVDNMDEVIGTAQELYMLAEMVEAIAEALPF